MHRSSVAPLIRRWRLARNLSQGRLAELAEVSTRHLSCLETGKSAPSREMILVLGSALELPLRERNALLLAAGFAPVYRESSLDEGQLRPLRRALELMLRHQEPFPALVVDRWWNVRMMNEGARRLLAFVAGDSSIAPSAMVNLLHAVFHPQGFRPFISKWSEVAAAMLDRLHREAELDPDDHVLRELVQAARRDAAVESSLRSGHAVEAGPVLPVVLQRSGMELSFFTTLTTLGTPLDVTAQEMRIESWFPVDDATEAQIRRLAEVDR